MSAELWSKMKTFVGLETEEDEEYVGSDEDVYQAPPA